MITQPSKRISPLFTIVIVLAIILLGWMFFRDFFVNKKAGDVQETSVRQESSKQQTPQIDHQQEASDTKSASESAADNISEPSLKAQPHPPYRQDAPILADEGPRQRRSKLDLPPTPQENQTTISPTEETDVQWTKPLAVPDAPKPSPDPFTTPPMKVNPKRGQ